MQFFKLNVKKISILLLQSFLLSVFLTTVFLFIATIFFKVSLHAGAWGNVVCFAILCSFGSVQYAIPFLILSIFIAGLIGSARLALNEHSNKQIYAGYFLGSIASLLSFAVIKTFY